MPMAAFAAVTERIKVGSGVIPIWTRNVGLLAATFSTLDELAPGRVMLGLGAWWDPLASKVGVHRHHSLQAMREVVEATRRLLAMERVTYHGEFVHLDDVEIDIVHGDRSPRQVPIYVGATGMKMMELAGEIGDGVVLNYMVGPEYNKRALEALAAGADRAGRTLDDIDRPQLVVCSVDADRDAGARPVARAAHPVPGPAAAHHEGERRRPGAASRRSARSSPGPPAAEEIRKAMRLVPDDAVQMITRLGHAGRVPGEGQRVHRRRRTCPILYPLGDDVRLMIDTFAPAAN